MFTMLRIEQALPLANVGAAGELLRLHVSKVLVHAPI